MTDPAIIGLIVLTVAVLLAVSQRGASAPAPANIMDPAAWEIGPIMPDGENYSVGVPLHPLSHPEGWCIDIPHPTAEAGHVHYVTVPTNSLAGKTRITLRCRLEMAEGVKLCPVHSPDAPSLLTLYLQRKDDDWSAQGKYEAYRWYASFGTQSNLHAGEYVLEARFDANWTAILTSSRASNPAAFDSALVDAGRVGFVLGGGDGLGHGVFATGPARLVVTEFRVE
jgi:hypothetical protein